MNKLIAGVVLVISWGTSVIGAPLKITITQGQFAPTPVAVTEFLSRDNISTEKGREISEIVGKDLASSGLFSLIDPTSFIQDLKNLHRQGPRFEDWNVLKTRYVLSGKVMEESGGKLRVDFRLYNVLTKSETLSLSITAPKVKWRRIAHKVADSIYKRITGEEAYFNSAIVYVEVTGSGKSKVRRLVMIDSDGANPRYLTDGKHMVLMPRFSPKATKVAYLTFINKKAQVFLMDVASAIERSDSCDLSRTLSPRKAVIGHFRGLSFAPNFSPDAEEVVMSLAQNGATALYKRLVNGGKMISLTPLQANKIDTSPCYSPDGKNIVFTSDRGGTKEQLYVMDRDGSNVRRISFGRNLSGLECSYSQPVWSPRGDWIAFTKKANSKFYIGVMKPDGTEERMIAEGFLVEAPTWAPNGRLLLYTAETRIDRQGRGGKSSLYQVDLVGGNPRRLPTPREAASGTWSRLLS